ncbi:MAG: glycosyl transferase, group 1 [uncultured bacterium]|nr:MAG: glycosyl transferase, group 1 [uncultured bacterium]
MNIGFDINEANVPQRVGVNQVAYNIFVSMVRNLSEGDRIYALGKERPLPDMPPASDKLVYEIFGSKRAWVLTSLTKRLWFGKPKVDVLFSPSHYSPIFSPVKSAIYLMDLSFERFGTEYFTGYDINQLKKWTPISVKKANKIFTISEFSKSEIVRLYGTDPAKIEVVYPAFDKEVFHGKIPKTKQIAVRKKYEINGGFILYWGTLQPRKNISKLIEAFSLLKESRLKLVIVGKRGWLYDQILEQAQKLGIANRVIFTGFAPTEDLPALIKASRAFVLPSLYEGFGLPVVEAQAVGTPVVVSAVSSLPEVTGESGIFIEDPTSVTGIKEALEKVMTLTVGARSSIIKAGKENTRRFDWDSSAQKIISILKNI